MLPGLLFGLRLGLTEMLLSAWLLNVHLVALVAPQFGFELRARFVHFGPELPELCPAAAPGPALAELPDRGRRAAHQFDHCLDPFASLGRVVGH